MKKIICCLAFLLVLIKICKAQDAQSDTLHDVLFVIAKNNMITINRVMNKCSCLNISDVELLHSSIDDTEQQLINAPKSFVVIKLVFAPAKAEEIDKLKNEIISINEVVTANFQ